MPQAGLISIRFGFIRMFRLEQELSRPILHAARELRIGLLLC